jgi:hypothetical protein
MKHRFFDGPIRELSPLTKGLTYIEEADVEEETYHDNHLFPRRASISGRRSVSGSKLDKRSSSDVQRPSRRSSVRDKVGLRTVLEEIGVSDDYQRRTRPAEIPSKGVYLYPHRRNRQENEDESRSVSDDSPRSPRLLRHESPAIDKGTRREKYEESTDSYSGQKEAEFDHYESDYKHRAKHDDPRRTKHVADKSPGEGLRNALGNLDNCLNVPAVRQRQLSAIIKSGLQRSQQPVGRTRAPNSLDARHNHCPRRQDQGVLMSVVANY